VATEAGKSVASHTSSGVSRGGVDTDGDELRDQSKDENEKKKEDDPEPCSGSDIEGPDLGHAWPAPYF